MPLTHARVTRVTDGLLDRDDHDDDDHEAGHEEVGAAALGVVPGADARLELPDA